MEFTPKPINNNEIQITEIKEKLDEITSPSFVGDCEKNIQEYIVDLATLEENIKNLLVQKAEPGLTMNEMDLIKKEIDQETQAQISIEKKLREAREVVSNLDEYKDVLLDALGKLIK